LVLQTERLLLYELTPEAAPFALELLNDPSFIQNIGDRGVRSLDDAAQYLLRGPIQSQLKNGFSMYRVEIRETGESIGMSGLVKREGLEEVDLGFAFLPRFWSMGYALESARAVLGLAKNNLSLEKLVAIISPSNLPSIHLLEKLGFQYEKDLTLPRENKPLKLFSLSLVP